MSKSQKYLKIMYIGNKLHFGNKKLQKMYAGLNNDKYY